MDSIDFFIIVIVCILIAFSFVIFVKNIDRSNYIYKKKLRDGPIKNIEGGINELEFSFDLKFPVETLDISIGTNLHNNNNKNIILKILRDFNDDANTAKLVFLGQNIPISVGDKKITVSLYKQGDNLIGSCTIIKIGDEKGIEVVKTFDTEIDFPKSWGLIKVNGINDRLIQDPSEKGVISNFLLNTVPEKYNKKTNIKYHALIYLPILSIILLVLSLLLQQKVLFVFGLITCVVTACLFFIKDKLDLNNLNLSEIVQITEPPATEDPHINQIDNLIIENKTLLKELDLCKNPSETDALTNQQQKLLEQLKPVVSNSQTKQILRDVNRDASFSNLYY